MRGPGGGGDPIAAYVTLVRQRIDAHKRYPAMARRRGLEGVVTVRIRIADDGSVERTVTLGEVPRLFEKTALEAVQKAAPFPPPPARFGELEVAIRYELDE
jgi:protein TonB